MGLHESAVEACSGCADRFGTKDCQVYVGDDVPKSKTKKATASYAPRLDPKEVIILLDTSVLHDGSAGAIITDSKLYYADQALGGKKHKVWFDEVESASLVSTVEKPAGEVQVEKDDGSKVCWKNDRIDSKARVDLINELSKLNHELSGGADAARVAGPRGDNDSAAVGAGAAVAEEEIAQRAAVEEKFHARQGHGYAAERAENRHDVLHGKDAKVVGDNNVKDGPDRLIHNPDGSDTLIQTKYCKTGRACIDNCFRDGEFRYVDASGNPMIIEVPSDKYEDAVQAMQGKIKSGQVPGVSDPDAASSFVKQGNYTYKQAVNIAKAGNIDSLKYDAASGAVVCVSAFGISMVITFATSIWNGDDAGIALQRAAFSGLKVGGTAFVVSVVASQLSKAGLNSALVSSSEALAKQLGPKAYTALANSLRADSEIFGAAALKSASKLLRSNAITAVVTVAVLSTFDIKDAVEGRITGGQLAKNLLGTTASVIGGIAGFTGGSIAGTVVLPGVGTIAVGLGGSVVAAGAAEGAVNAVTNVFIKDDSEQMIGIINDEFAQVYEEYLLGGHESEKVSDGLSELLDAKKIKDMVASKDKKAFARGLMMPLVLAQVRRRRHVILPPDDEMCDCLANTIEDIKYEAEQLKAGNMMTDEQMDVLLIEAVSKYGAGIGSEGIKDVAKELETTMASREDDIEGLTYMKVRDALTSLGKIAEENEEEQTYVAIVGAGLANMNKAVVVAGVCGSKLLLKAYAKEGLIKQGTSKQAVDKVEKLVSERCA